MAIRHRQKRRAHRRRRERFISVPSRPVACNGHTVQVRQLPLFEYYFIKFLKNDFQLLNLRPHADEDMACKEMLNNNTMVYGTPGSERRALADAVVASYRQWQLEAVGGVHPEHTLMHFLLDEAMAIVGSPT